MNKGQKELVLGSETYDQWEAMEGLHDLARQRFMAWLLLCRWHGFGRIKVIDAKRTLERQNVLFGMGRSAEECVAAGVDPKHADPDRARVTWTKPSSSMHVRGLAIDADWGDYSEEEFGVCLLLARGLQITCGADWHVRDMFHFELEGPER